MRILFIEDNPDEAAIIKDKVELIGNKWDWPIQMIVTDTFEHGVEIASSFDAVWLDLTLGKDSPDRTLAKLEAWRGQLPPLFILTGTNDETIRAMCFKAGARGFWHKLNFAWNPENCLHAFRDHMDYFKETKPHAISNP